jgi:hypothetical protein
MLSTFVIFAKLNAKSKSMKKLVLFFLLLSSGLFAQENLFHKIKGEIIKEHPDIVWEDKLLIVNVWSVSDQQSREANVQLNKVVNVYEHARLKGGRKGVIGVVVCKDNDEKMEIITLGKDEVVKPKRVSSPLLKSEGFSNIVFDSEGNEVERDIPSKSVFSSIQKLITR